VNAFIKAHQRFKDRETLDKQLEISSRGRVWVYDEAPPVDPLPETQTH